MPGLTRSRPQAPLTLPGPVAAEIAAAARRAAPLEACGVLLGRCAGGGAEVVRTAPARNVHPRPAERFDLAPEDLLAAEKRARAEGLEVVGFWHSHPASAAVPSAVDRQRAWEGYSYLIVSLAAAGRPVLRSWRLGGGEAREEPIRGLAPGAGEPAP